MISKFRYYPLFLLFLLVASCSNREVEELRAKMAEDNECVQREKRRLSSTQISQYQDIELTLNKRYVKDLKELVDNSFEKQIEVFEDEQLGVISGYRHMIQYVVMSKDKWHDLQMALSNKYFSSLNVEQMALELSMAHNEQVKDLRTKFRNASKNAPTLHVLNLPDSEIYLGELESHSRNNLVIEIGTEILDWLFGLLLVWIVLNVIGYATTGPVGCIITIVSLVVNLIVSVILTNKNDGKLIETLKQQNTEKNINYDGILKKLNSNTIDFYEACK